MLSGVSCWRRSGGATATSWIGYPGRSRGGYSRDVMLVITVQYVYGTDDVIRILLSLHDEIVAQRALDRRLTSELKKFKSRITVLTE